MSALPPILIAGAGYIGKRLIDQLDDQAPITTINSQQSSMQTIPVHCQRLQVDLDQSSDHPIPCAHETVIYYFIPPTSTDQTDPRIRQFLNRLQEPPALFVLISTTGVYGDCGDDWVDESRPPNPAHDRAKRRLDAEQQLHNWCSQTGSRYVILRVPGIYGPGKLPLERLRSGKPVLKESESPWSNRVHADDLVQACLKCLSYTGDSAVFNVSDGHPSTMTDYFNAVASRFGIDQPPQITLQQCRQQFSANMMSYLTESKRIDNTRMREQLGVELQYPTLDAGLAMITDE